MIASAFRIALSAINRHRLRSFLTVLGVIIGVWSVVTVVTLGDATTRAVTASISALGSNTLTLSPSAADGSQGTLRKFAASDPTALALQTPGLSAVAPMVSTSQVVLFNAANWRTTVLGVTSEYIEIQGLELAGGRPFSREDLDAGKAVCLIGDEVRGRLFGGQDVEGTKMRVGGISCEVIGSLAAKGQGLTGNTDDSVLMPLKAVQRQLIGDTDIDSIVLAYDASADGETVRDTIVSIMRERRGLRATEENDFALFDARQLTETVTNTTQMLTGLLTAVGAVSLLVGGIGIMNIMLVSVTERTREIGLRLALGALSRDVLTQFLVEAIVLSCIGGLIGLALANLTSILASPLIGVTFAFNPGVNLVAFAVSAAVGVVFGFAPARRAARLNPIDALRRE